MTLLSEAFRQQVQKTKDLAMTTEQQHTVAYSTGFLPFDFQNGYLLRIGDKAYPQLGIMDGSINAVISRSGEGKTTICTQIAANIIRPFKSSCVFIDNAESGENLARAMQLAQIDSQEFKDRFILRDAGITTESIYERVKIIAENKEAHKDEWMYDTGIIDEYGKHIIKFEPTVYILDSLKAILPKKLSEDEGSNMNGATTARINSDIFLRLIPMCRLYNIIILVINHITQSGIGSIMPQKSSIAYLKQGESLPGGRTAGTYLNNNIIRLDNVSKLKSSEAFGIDGAIVNVEIIKSRSSKAGKGCKLVFNQDIGYDPDLSMFIALKDRGVLEGAGAFLRLPNSDIKFSQKNFKSLLYSNPEFQQQFISTVANTLMKEFMERNSSIANTIDTVKAKPAYLSVLDEIQKICNNGDLN